MIRLYVLILLIAVGFILSRRLLAARFSAQLLYSKTTWSVLLGCIVLLLAVTGHLAWLVAMLGVGVAFIVRNLPLIVRYAPYLQRFWYSFRASKQQRGSTGYTPTSGGKMTVAEAYKILGLKPPVAREDIITAHKKLMQKMHPDRGGSDYLASQINLAKDLLLKN